MTNEQIISKMKDDMKMRGFSHWTEESYLGKTKYIMKYFNKPMEKVETEELMKEIKLNQILMIQFYILFAIVNKSY